MKDYIKKHKILFIIFIILFIILLILPFIVNFNNKESSTDYVNYYGMILTSIFSSIVTITIFYFTLNENRRQLDKERENVNQLAKEERKLTLMPYFSTLLTPSFDIGNFIKDENIRYIEISYKNNQYSISSTIETPYCLNKINNKQEKIEKTFLYSKFFSNNYIFYYDITNGGAGNAINVVLKINDNRILPEFSLLKNKTLRFRFYFKFKSANLNKEIPIKLRFEFSDVTCENKYFQEETIRIYKPNDNIDSFTAKINEEEMLSKPHNIYDK